MPVCEGITMLLRTKAIITSVALVLLTVGAQGQLTTSVVAPEAVRLGDPIKVSVVVANQGSLAVEVNRGTTAFDCFEVTDPDGKRLVYVGFDGQIGVNRVGVQPSAKVTAADALDLTDKYLFQKPGRYSVRFRGDREDLARSPTVSIDVAPGQMTEFDQVAACLLPVIPSGWHLAKDVRGEIAPRGRSKVDGFALHLCRSHMRGEAVYLWFSKAEANVDPNQQTDGKSEYLGRARGFNVYVEVGSNTPPLWPKSIDDISRALQAAKE